MFLDDDELAKLTGYKQKGKQVAFLKHMKIPFFVNACGHPIVARTAVEGKKEEKRKAEWVPSWAGNRLAT